MGIQILDIQEGCEMAAGFALKQKLIPFVSGRALRPIANPKTDAARPLSP